MKHLGYDDANHEALLLASHVIPRKLLEEFINTGRMKVRAGWRPYVLCDGTNVVAVKRGICGYCVHAYGEGVNPFYPIHIPIYDQLASLYLTLKFNRDYFNRKAVRLGPL